MHLYLGVGFKYFFEGGTFIRTFISISIFIVITIMIVLSFNKWMTNDNILLYNDYVVENSNENVIYEFNNNDFNIKFRWINDNVLTGPYYLYASLEALNQNVEYIYITNIEIISSLNNQYDFTDIKNYPFYIYDKERKLDNIMIYSVDNSNKRYFESSDLFYFEHENNEQIKLQINFIYSISNYEIKEKININFIPITKEFYAPIK